MLYALHACAYSMRRSRSESARARVEISDRQSVHTFYCAPYNRHTHTRSHPHVHVRPADCTHTHTHTLGVGRLLARSLWSTKIKHSALGIPATPSSSSSSSTTTRANGTHAGRCASHDCFGARQSTPSVCACMRARARARARVMKFT